VHSGGAAPVACGYMLQAEHSRVKAGFATVNCAS
jgi:hypothetical protein